MKMTGNKISESEEWMYLESNNPLRRSGVVIPMNHLRCGNAKIGNLRDFA